MDAHYKSTGQTQGPLFMNNSTSNICTTSLLEDRTLVQHVREGITLILLIISVLLNFTIVIAVCLVKRLHTIPHVCIASLAVSDLVISIIAGSANMLPVSQCSFQNQSIYTYVVIIVFLFGIYANILNHLFISVVQWLYIARPFLYQRIVTRRLTVCCLVFAWIVSGAANFNLLVGQYRYETISSSINAGIICPAVHFSLSLILFTIYSHIAVIARRQIQMINKTRPLGVSIECPTVITPRTSVKTAWKNVRLLVTVFGTFFTLMTPAMCLVIYGYIFNHEIFSSEAGIIVGLIWYSHCCTNFFIFAVKDNVFRAVLRRGLMKFGCGICSKTVHLENAGV